MSTQNERPVIFNSEIVKAILDGRKTQTRRIAKLPEEWHRGYGAFEVNPNGAEEFVIHGDCGTETMYCPYGRVGDTLWVREAWWDLGYWKEGQWFGRTASHKIRPKYVVDGEPEGIIAKHKRSSLICKWRKRPSIHMPRWAARIFLEITSIRVERVQDISESNIISEGCPEFTSLTGIDELYAARQWWWVTLWDSINAKRGFGWDKNPWVWVVEWKQYPK